MSVCVFVWLTGDCCCSMEHLRRRTALASCCCCCCTRAIDSLARVDSFASSVVKRKTRIPLSFFLFLFFLSRSLACLSVPYRCSCRSVCPSLFLKPQCLPLSLSRCFSADGPRVNERTSDCEGVRESVRERCPLNGREREQRHLLLLFASREAGAEAGGEEEEREKDG